MTKITLQFISRDQERTIKCTKDMMLKYTMHCIYESTLVQRLSRGDLTLFPSASIFSFYDIFKS